MATKFDPVSWVKGAPVTKKITKCYTCQHLEVVKAVDLILTTIANGEANKVSIMQIWAIMKEAYGYKYSYTTFKGHINACARDLWIKAYGHNRSKK